MVVWLIMVIKKVKRKRKKILIIIKIIMRVNEKNKNVSCLWNMMLWYVLYNMWIVNFILNNFFDVIGKVRLVV